MKCIIVFACLLPCLTVARVVVTATTPPPPPCHESGGVCNRPSSNATETTLEVFEFAHDVVDNEINWNQVVDFILASYGEELKSSGKEQLPMPDLEEPFTTRVALLKVSGNFTARDGYFRNLSTLHRTADVTIAKEDVAAHTYTLSSALGIGEVRVVYNEYRLKVKSGAAIEGSISGSVGKNSIALTVEVDMNDVAKCKATLKEIRVLQIEDMKLRLTGFGWLNGLASSVASKAIRKRKAFVVQKIESALIKALGKALGKVKCNF